MLGRICYDKTASVEMNNCKINFLRHMASEVLVMKQADFDMAIWIVLCCFLMIACVTTRDLLLRIFRNLSELIVRHLVIRGRLCKSKWPSQHRHVNLTVALYWVENDFCELIFVKCIKKIQHQVNFVEIRHRKISVLFDCVLWSQLVHCVIAHKRKSLHN